MSATELTKVQAKVQVDFGTNCPLKPDFISHRKLRRQVFSTGLNLGAQADRYIVYEGVKILKN